MPSCQVGLWVEGMLVVYSGGGKRRPAMQRTCSHCEKPLTNQDLARAESEAMEAERKDIRLQGVHFVYYRCAQCGHATIFVDTYAQPGETYVQLRQRRK